MPQLLSPLESKYYWDSLEFAHLDAEGDYHKKIQQIHVLFLSLINTLTEQREKQVFTGWFAKINFIAQAYNLSTEEEANLQALRRLFRRNLVGKNFEPQKGHFLVATKIIAELTALFSEDQIPLTLLKRYEGQELPFIQVQEAPSATLKVLTAVIVDKGELQTTSNGLKQITLRCDTERYGVIEITVSDIPYYSQKGEIFRKYALSEHCAYLARPFQTIRLTYLKQLEPNHFCNTAQTLLIVSPDYLVDASAIARCFGTQYKSPYLYLLDKLKFFQGSIPTFRGNVLNNLLDNLVEKGEKTFEEALQDIMPEVQVEAAMLGLQMEHIHETAQIIAPQYDNLVKVMADFKDAAITTEPSFISARYGLQGRIDLLVEYPGQADRKDIIELKSTKFPNPQQAIARKDHLVQVACYNLMLQSTFQKRNGTSAVLYSQDYDAPMRNCGKLDFESQEAMWARNCMVFIDSKIAEGEVDFYNSALQRLSKLSLPFYIMEDLDIFRHRWQISSSLERQYFAALMGLVAREQWVAKVGGISGSEPSQGFASLWRNAPEEKLENFALLYPLTISEVSESGSEIKLHRLHSQSEVTAFRAGDIMVLYPLIEGNALKPQRAQLLKGSIQKIDSQSVHIKIWSQSIDKSYFEKFTTWAIEPNLMESSFKHLYASLSEFLGFDKDKKARYLGLEKPEFNLAFSDIYKENLSNEQNHILNQALACEDYFLLQGPPGTGKTSQMLRSMVDYLYHQTEETIVLLAFTNRATDEICEKIKSVCDNQFIRLGNLNKDQVFWGNTLKSVKSLTEIHDKLQKARIFVSTVSSFYNFLHLIPRYDTIIVDEASQLLEPHLCGILPRFRRFILVGDEKQLPAVVTQPSNFCQNTSEELTSIGLGDLSISVFERLLLNAQAKGWHHCFAMLSTQFRTHEDIAGFINQEFYKKLSIGSEKQQEAFTLYDAQSKDEIEQKLAQSRLIFIPSQIEKHLKFHYGEAHTIQQLLEVIREAFRQRGGFTEESVGVITPYRAQIAEIYRLLDDELREKVSVDTVERYQGSERQVIIISMAVNHPALMHNLQSLNVNQTVDKKLNVALSRAKEQLILLGNPNVLSLGKYYNLLLSYIQKKGSSFQIK